MAREISSLRGSGMGISQLLEGLSEQCRRHSILHQQRRPVVVGLLFKVLRVSSLNQGCRRRRKQIADIADIEGPESSHRGTLQQTLPAVAPVRMTQFMGENRQNVRSVANL